MTEGICPECKGRKNVPYGDGWKLHKRTCPTCQGKGKAQPSKVDREKIANKIVRNSNPSGAYSGGTYLSDLPDTNDVDPTYSKAFYLSLADQIIALRPDEIRKQERSKYDEAIILVGEVAGLNQAIFASQDIASLSDRAEEIIQALKEE